jgi:hypothetical protein
VGARAERLAELQRLTPYERRKLYNKLTAFVASIDNGTATPSTHERRADNGRGATLQRAHVARAAVVSLQDRDDERGYMLALIARRIAPCGIVRLVDLAKAAKVDRRRVAGLRRMVERSRWFAPCGGDRYRHRSDRVVLGVDEVEYRLEDVPTDPRSFAAYLTTFLATVAGGKRRKGCGMISQRTLAELRHVDERTIRRHLKGVPREPQSERTDATYTTWHEAHAAAAQAAEVRGGGWFVRKDAVGCYRLMRRLPNLYERDPSPARCRTWDGKAEPLPFAAVRGERDTWRRTDGEAFAA